MNNTEARPHLGLVQAGIIVLTLATAIIHLYFVFFDEAMTQKFVIMFILNSLGYVGLLAALYLPISFLASLRPIARFLLILQAAASIAAYIYVGVFSTLGWVTKGIEVLLILLLLIEAGISRSRS